MRKKNDILLKSAFEESFADLLYFFFKDADIVFDFERGFDFMDKELAELFPDLDKKGGSRFVDDENQLIEMDNLFALIVLAAQKGVSADKIPESELGEQRLGIVRTLLESKRYNNEKIRRFLFFLKTFI